MNSLVLVVLVVVLGVLASGESGWYGQLEAPCAAQGGLCLARGECAAPLGRPGELCPQQAAHGFQCCRGLPLHETRCSFQGGECFPHNFCNQRFVYSEATDCPADQQCCILI